MCGSCCFSSFQLCLYIWILSYSDLHILFVSLTLLVPPPVLWQFEHGHTVFASCAASLLWSSSPFRAWSVWSSCFYIILLFFKNSSRWFDLVRIFYFVFCHRMEMKTELQDIISVMIDKQLVWIACRKQLVIYTQFHYLWIGSHIKSPFSQRYSMLKSDMVCHESFMIWYEKGSKIDLTNSFDQWNC